MMNNKIVQTSFPIKIINKLIRTFGFDFHIVPSIYGRSARKQYDIRENEEFYKISKSIINENTTLLYYDRLYTLYQAINQASKCVRKDKSFNTIEVGVFKGGGSKFICECLKKFEFKNSHFAVDTFEGHSIKDVKKSTDGWHVTDTFIETSYEKVQKYLMQYNFANVKKGRIQDVYDNIINTANEIHFAHLDVDIEEPTIFMLNKFETHMPAGGIVVIDDYGFRSCPGMREAVKKLVDISHSFIGIELLTGQMILIKR